MSNGSGSGVGGAVGTLAGMAAMYWLAVAFAVVWLGALLSAVVAVVAAMAAIYGAIRLIARSARATADGDWRWLGRMYVPPLLSLVGLSVALVSVAFLDVNVQDLFAAEAFDAATDDLHPLLVLGLIVFRFGYAMFLWTGWLIGIIAATLSERGRPPFVTAGIWTAWGACFGLLGSETLLELRALLLG